MPQWKSLLAGTAAIIVVLGAGYAAVRWLTPEPIVIISQAVPSLEAEWNNTIARLGIDPVYPPEEDLMVGDLLAIVVSDEEDPNETKNNKLDATSPILRRAVKLAHIDLRQELGKAYSMLTMFPAAASPQVGSNPVSGQSGPRVFTGELPKGELPYAAFPSLKIQADNSAAFGLSVPGRGSAKFGAGNQGLEELHLTDVRTYGLPSARALEALTAYCTNEKTSNDCLEPTARKHLERVVGSRIYNMYADDKGTNRFGVKIEVALVNRVYLTSSILHVRRIGSAQGGGLRARAKPEQPGPQPAPQPAAQAPARNDIDELKQRLKDVEAQLSKTSPGGVLTFESESGSEILLKETFDRPIAIGIRTVRFDFPEQSQPKTAAPP